MTGIIPYTAFLAPVPAAGLQPESIHAKGTRAARSKFLEYNWLDSFQNLYHLDMHREEMIRLEGFGVKSYDNLWASTEASRHTTFERCLVAMDIPLVGRIISRSLRQQFHESLDNFEQAATGAYDCIQLEDIGTIINDNIHTWFSDMGNLQLWKELQKEMIFEERKEETMNVEQHVTCQH